MLFSVLLFACKSPIDEPTPTLEPAPTPAPNPVPTLPTELDVDTVDLAGRALDTHPDFTVVQAFQAGEDVVVAVSSTQDATCDLYVFEHRTDWQELTLTDVRGASQEIDLVTGPRALNSVVLTGTLDAHGPRGTGQAYDLVLDCDRDGTLSPGDRIDGIHTPGFTLLPDLTATGPSATTRLHHDGGTFLEQIITHPAVLDGEHPVVMIAHGFGHELTYYDHLSEHLASYGYIVSSFRNDVGNGDGPGTRSAATTLLQNTEHLLTSVPELAGHLDADNIVWIGHSTGGECVVHGYTQLANGDFNSPAYDADSIRLVSSMAPVAWLGTTASNPLDVNFHLITGGADRDTGNYPEPGYTQNMALFERATGNRHLTYIHGAGHGDLHAGSQNWLDMPDPDGPALIGTSGAHPVVKALHLALIERYVQDDLAMKDALERADFHFHGIPSNVVYTREYRPALSGPIGVIDDFQSGPELTISSQGEPVLGDVSHATESLMTDQNDSFTWTGNQPANGMTRNSAPGDDARALIFDFQADSSLLFDLPEVDVSRFQHLLFRVAQGTRHPLTTQLGGPVDFGVTLIDGAGLESTVSIAPYASVSPPYARTNLGPGAGWANEFITVRLPLADFAGLDPEDLVQLRFDFGPSHGSSQARLALDDLMWQ